VCAREREKEKEKEREGGRKRQRKREKEREREYVRQTDTQITQAKIPDEGLLSLQKGALLNGSEIESHTRALTLGHSTRCSPHRDWRGVLLWHIGPESRGPSRL